MIFLYVTQKHIFVKINKLYKQKHLQNFIKIDHTVYYLLLSTEVRSTIWMSYSFWNIWRFFVSIRIRGWKSGIIMIIYYIMLMTNIVEALYNTKIKSLTQIYKMILKWNIYILFSIWLIAGFQQSTIFDSLFSIDLTSGITKLLTIIISSSGLLSFII